MTDPAEMVNALGAVWSPNLDAYAAGDVDSPQCVLCGPVCECRPFADRKPSEYDDLSDDQL